MKWEIKEAEFGDAVRVKIGRLYHYGIYVSDGEVIQFGLPPTSDRKAEDVAVVSSPVDEFLAGGFLEVGVPEGRERRAKRKNVDIVAAAQKRLGEKGYDVLKNNCEHFVNLCVFGKAFSTQTDGVVERLNAAHVLDVYVARFPFETSNTNIFPPERAAEIDACGNPAAKDEKYYVWKLLEYALMRSFGVRIENADVRFANGKWECSACCFSLSHSGNAVAVAVSTKAVGVDIEKYDPARFAAGIRKKVLTAREARTAEKMTEMQAGEFANTLWTVKEAAYKCGEPTSVGTNIGKHKKSKDEINKSESGKKASGSGGGFVPSAIESTRIKYATRRAKTESGEYIVTVASKDAQRAAFATYGGRITVGL